jgi:hypothetical protein
MAGQKAPQLIVNLRLEIQMRPLSRTLLLGIVFLMLGYSAQAVTREECVDRLREMLAHDRLGCFHPTQADGQPWVIPTQVGDVSGDAAVSVDGSEEGQDAYTDNWAWGHPQSWIVFRVDSAYTPDELAALQEGGHRGHLFLTHRADTAHSEKSLAEMTQEIAEVLDSCGFYLGGPSLQRITGQSLDGHFRMIIPPSNNVNPWGIPNPALNYLIYRSPNVEDLYTPNDFMHNLLTTVPASPTNYSFLDSIMALMNFYTVVPEDLVHARMHGSPMPPDSTPTVQTVPLQEGYEDVPNSFPAVHLPNYVTDDKTNPEHMRYAIIGQTGHITGRIVNNDLFVDSMVEDSASIATTTVSVTDRALNTANLLVNYQILPMTDLNILVWDFDRQVVDSAKVRIKRGTDSTDYATTNGWVHAQVLPTDNVTIRSWRNTPDPEWIGITPGADSLSSYIRTEQLPALTDRIDTTQVQTWDVCDSMNVSPQDYKDWINTARGIRINGVRVLGGINPETMNLDTLWYGKISPITGDTLYDWQQDSLQNEAQRLKDTQLFPDSPYPHHYQSHLGETEQYRPHLHRYYKHPSICDIGLDINANGSTIAASTNIQYSLPIGCIRQEIATNIACTNPTPINIPSMSGKSIIYEAWPSEDYTYADKEMFRVWAQTPPNTSRDNIYGLSNF